MKFIVSTAQAPIAASAWEQEQEQEQSDAHSFGPFHPPTPRGGRGSEKPVYSTMVSWGSL